jgi:DNA-binding transcriptional ArsR family regulator
MVNRSLDPLDAVFGALAHPARRRMLEQLATGAASVGQLAEPFRMSAPAISRHLRVLEAAGLVLRARDGRVHRMDLAGSQLAGAMQWLDTNHRFWSARFDRLAEMLEEPDAPAAPVPAPAPPEVPEWPHPRPAPASRSRSSATSRRRPSASSKPSRRPRK